MDAKQLEQLKAPFPLEAHYWKPGATTKDKSRALGLAYVDSRQYQTRLDEVDTAWTITYTPHFVDGRILVNCTLVIAGITREDVGECSLRDENAYTSAVAQAFKRTCAQFGLGRYIYDVPQVWAAYDKNRKRFSPQGLQTLHERLQRALAGAVDGNGNGRRQPQPKAEAKAEGSNGKGTVPAMSDTITKRARAYELDFGKHSGETLGEVLDEDVGYVEWLSENAPDDKVCAASAYLFAHFGGNGHGNGKPFPNGTLTLEEALAFTIPFGTKNNPEYKGKTLSYVEGDDPGMVDWLAEKARSPQLREAAEAIVASRKN